MAIPDALALEAVVFDFDGTLVDTEMLQYRAWRAVLTPYGAPFGLADWRQAVGRASDAFDPVALAACRIGRRLDGPAVRAAYADELLRRMERCRLRRGVRGWLTDARRRGLRLGVASNSPGAWVHGWLGRLGLADHFAVVVTCEEVRRPKPAPDLYRLAVRRLAVAPAAALAVEDSPFGCQAALAAGLRCVVVPNAFTRPQRFPPEASLLPAFGQPPWA